jgi:hypothetical protein
VNGSTAEPIFIHGILPRSGTNFLWDLMLLHPACAPAVPPVREDLFLDHSDHLVAFAAEVRAAWDPRWGLFDPDIPQRLHAALGEGLTSFLWVERDRRLLTKSPSVRHLERFFSFFPSARLLVLIRDGRSVVQSCMDTFGWEFERAARAWAEAAKEVLRFQSTQSKWADQWRIIRYEDLVDDLDAHLPGVLEHAGLDVAAYDMEAARNLPVRGSSVHLGEGHSSIHWEPVPRSPAFAPTERWRGWTTDDHQRFAWIAGEQMTALGYDLNAAPAPQDQLRQRFLDVRWSGAQARHRARTKLGVAARPLRDRLRERRGG